MLNENEVERLKEQGKKFFIACEQDWMAYDFDAEIGRDLSFIEAQSNLLEKIKIFLETSKDNNLTKKQINELDLKPMAEEEVKELQEKDKERFFDKKNIERVKEHILKHKVIFVCGNTGSGKTSTCFKLLEMFKPIKTCYIYDHPMPELVEPYGFKILYGFEELEYMSKICLYIDEPQLVLPTIDRRNNDKMQKLMSLCRQRDITLIFSTSNTRYINKAIESYIDGWFIKDINFEQVKQGSYIKQIIKRNAVIDPVGFSMAPNKVLYSNINNKSLEGKYNISETNYYSEDLSKAYGLD